MEERKEEVYILMPVMTLLFLHFEQSANLLLWQWALQVMWQVLAPRLGKAGSLPLLSIWKVSC